MPTREPIQTKRKRIVEIDFVRGVLIWFMIVDHLFYDFWGIAPNFFTSSNPHLLEQLYNLQTIGYNYWSWSVRINARFAILSLFFLISGICTYFSRNRLKRGLIVFGVGVVISMGFLIFGKTPMGEGEYILFGAITCFGLSLLIYWLFRFIFNKLCPKHEGDFKWLILGLGILIIAIGLMFDCWNTYNNGAPWLDEPLSIKNFFLVIIGYRQDAEAIDWLPLFPYLGFMFVGSFIGETLYRDRKSYFKELPSKPAKDAPLENKIVYYGAIMPYKGIKNVATFSGHFSLLFYLLHQVALILIFGIVLLAMGYQLAF